MNQIFLPGWESNLLIYGAVYLVAEYCIYKLIFRSLMGRPKSFSWREIRAWSRKANFIGAVIFAPLFEEFMFTYLAYASFLNYAQPGSEAIVLLMVATFFALLHLPGDLRQQRSRYSGIRLYPLVKFQLQRFFYSLTAYFIFISTGSLWVTIVLHYFYNAVVSVYQFEAEDRFLFFQRRDLNLMLILSMNLIFAIYAGVQFYQYYPSLGLLILALLSFSVLDSVIFLRKAW